MRGQIDQMHPLARGIYRSRFRIIVRFCRNPVSRIGFGFPLRVTSPRFALARRSRSDWALDGAQF